MKGTIWSLIYSVTPNIDETDVTYFYTEDECEKSYEESTCKEEQESHRGQMNDFCVKMTRIDLSNLKTTVIKSFEYWYSEDDSI